MKNKIHVVFILFIVLTTRFLCFGEILSESKYAELSRLFDIDVQLMENSRETYTKYKAKSLQTTFSNSRVLNLNRNQNKITDIEKVLIIVNSSIYDQLTDKIKRYAYDINMVYGCQIIMEAISGGDHINIKNLILSNQTDLDGVVFIGDIQPAWFEVENDYNGYAGANNQGYGYAAWPSDLYYMDLNGTWIDTDGNDIYDSHTGDVMPEIFAGRISTANMGTLISEIEGLVKYLDKNHNFWIGNTNVNKKFGLSYTDKDWTRHDNFKTDIQFLYGDTNYDQINYGDAEFGKSDYLSRLNSDRYEFIQLSCHANATYLGMTGEGIYSNEIFNNGTEAIGYNLFCCGACNWTAASNYSNQGFLAGSHVYNANNSSLVVVGSTKTGSMLSFANFYTPLGQGKTIGESLKNWWINVFGNTHSSYVIYWHYGMSIIGDPMVNFFHTANNCPDQITLSNFDTTNTDSHRNIEAQNKITVNNYIIPSGKHVVFNAKEVILNSGFECKSGVTFEIKNEGCISDYP